ncbi:uncharacterized protein LOC142576674 [Dermacentor variabilis]|uniref:uncharacterized protein LOC142576674 n=1 Tax=Dermacentor variabilis TaxID=34621 RepID=UPI003F5C165B
MPVTPAAEMMFHIRRQEPLQAPQHNKKTCLRQATQMKDCVQMAYHFSSHGSRQVMRTWRTVSLSPHLPQVGGSFPVREYAACPPSQLGQWSVPLQLLDSCSCSPHFAQALG